MKKRYRAVIVWSFFTFLFCLRQMLMSTMYTIILEKKSLFHDKKHNDVVPSQELSKSNIV